MINNKIRTAMMHYSAPPTVGGVEAVIRAHAKTFIEEGYPVSVITGTGEKAALPPGVGFVHLPMLDSQHKDILKINEGLEKGIVQKGYYKVRDNIKTHLEEKLQGFDNVIVHNVFSKHYNLPFTEALHQLLDEGKIKNCIAWCHDFSWATERDKPFLYDRWPWDLLRTFREDTQYVVVSKKRQRVMAKTFNIPKRKIKVIYNGIGPKELMGVSEETNTLIESLGLDRADLIVLMPVRVTHAKNIELAMHVAARLRSEHCTPQFLMTGPPDPHDPENLAYFEELKKLRTRLKVEKNFRFLYEENPDTDEAYILDMKIVEELYRVCDLVFMPSHSEGFGMPILEAGFAGKPVFATEIPAVVEIGGDDIHLIDLAQGPEKVAEQILEWASNDSVYQFRVKTRQKYTWQTIFRERIQPLLAG